MKVFGQLERAQIEILGADPSGAGLVQGRIWFNSSDNTINYYDGSAKRKMTVADLNADALAAAMTTTGTGSLSTTMTAAQVDALAAKMTTTGTGSIASTISTANANTIGGKITTAADTIAGQMTATGANAIGSVITSTGANAVRTASTRTTGTTVSAGGVAISTSCGNFSSTSTSATDVTNLTVTITTSGRPVALGLQADGTSNVNYIGVIDSISDAVTLIIFLVRDSTTLTEEEILFNVAPNGTSTDLRIPGSSFSYIDAVAAGTYTYKIQMAVGASNTGYFQYLKLVAYEL